MISNRKLRNAPQENLRQFSLNNSKGIDFTKSIVDSDTVSEMLNLTVNDDGTLSLREPYEESISLNPSGSVVNVWTTHIDEVYVAVVRSGNVYYLKLFKGMSISEVRYIPRVTKYYGLQKVDAESSNIRIYGTELQVIRTPTSTIIGNTAIGKDYLAGLGALDSDLYDASVTNVPRYLKFYTEVEGNALKYIIEVMSPELGSVSIAEGEISLNPNLTLDNPYAIRDIYNAAGTYAKSIVPYAAKNAGAVVRTGVTQDYSLNFDISNSMETDNGSTLYKMEIGEYASKEFSMLSNNYILEAKAALHDGYPCIDIKCYGNRTPLKDVRMNLDVYTNEDSTGTTFQLYAMYETLPNSSGEVFHKYLIVGRDAGTALGVYINDEPNTSFDVSDSYVTFVTVLPTYTSPTTSDVYYFKYFYTNVDPYDRDKYHSLKIKYSRPYFTQSGVDWDLKVNQITESSKSDRYYIVSKYGNISNEVFLKAFCNLANSESYYAAWEYSLDNVEWNPYGNLPGIVWFKTDDDHPYVYYPDIDGNKDPRIFIDVVDDLRSDVSLDNPSESTVKYRRVAYWPLCAASPEDAISPEDTIRTRVDVLPLSRVYDILLEHGIAGTPTLYIRFSIITPSADPISPNSTVYKVGSTISTVYHTVNPGSFYEYAEVEYPNAVLGLKKYYKKRIYTYGEDLKSTVLVSDVDSTITPIYNTISLDISSVEYTTQIVPWRDYLIMFTDKTTSLVSSASEGFYVKTLTTSLGLAKQDADSAKSALNGVLFKSEGSIYYAYPNLYSGDDTSLNITDISKPVNHLLDTYFTGSTFSTLIDTRYYLFSNNDGYNDGVTYALVYDLANKTWEFYKYPAKIASVFKEDSKNTVLKTSNHVLAKFLNTRAGYDSVVGDKLYAGINSGVGTDTGTDGLKPIPFMLDTGQKTDNISKRKQFVETKMVFATLSERDSFPFNVYVAVDGDPHVTKMDVSTDAPFWKTNGSVGVLGTVFRSGVVNEAAGAFNTLRQLVMRHSGKGRSIRYVIEGNSSYNFKMYETYVRYKNLNSK